MANLIPVNNSKAGLIMVLAMLIIGFIDNYIAIIAETASLWQFQIMRAGLALPILLIISVFGLGVLRPIRWWAVYFRSFLTALSMLFYFGSLAFVPFADALVGLTDGLFDSAASIIALQWLEKNRHLMKSA
mgnify:CR=1 FL=1